MRSRRTARAVLLGLVTALSVSLSACSDDQAAEPEEQPSAAPAWNPCSGLDAADVSALFGATYAVRTGTPSAPVCTFSPQTEGDPAVDVNYQRVVGTLGELLDTFGELEESGRTEVMTPRVRGADDARLIVDVSGDTLTVTGFVQNGRLVQIINSLDPRPYERSALLRNVVTMMGDLAANADTSGLTD